MRTPKGWREAVCLALVLSVALAGCGSSGHAVKGTLRIPMYGQVHVPDPAAASSSADLFVDSLLYSGLVKFSPDLHVIPELAVSLPTISPSGLAYTFTIRQDARFADGRPCTASDVAYSLARALRVGGANARRALGGIVGAAAVEHGLRRSLAGVQLVHRLTLRIHLRSPDAEFLQKLAFPVGSVVNRRVVPDRRMQSWPDASAGTGAWVFSTRERDGAVSLAPRPRYYGTLQLRSLVLVPVRDVSAGMALYRKGGLDVAEVPAPDIARLSSSSEMRQSNGLSAYYAVPVSGNPLSIAATLDRSRLVQEVGMGLSALDTIVPPSVPDYVSSPPTIQGPTGDPTVTVAGSPSGDRVMRILARALTSELSRRSAASRVRLQLVYATHLLPDPGAWIRVALRRTHSSWLRRSLRAAGKLTNDPVDRMDTYNRCERWVLQQGYVIPLASTTVAYLIKPSVQGMQVTPTGIMPDNNNWALAGVT